MQGACIRPGGSIYDRGVFRCVPLGPCAGNLQLLYGAAPGISYGKNEHGEGTGGVPFRGESGGTCSGGFLA